MSKERRPSQMNMKSTILGAFQVIGLGSVSKTPSLLCGSNDMDSVQSRRLGVDGEFTICTYELSPNCWTRNSSLFGLILHHYDNYCKLFYMWLVQLMNRVGKLDVLTNGTSGVSYVTTKLHNMPRNTATMATVAILTWRSTIIFSCSKTKWKFETGGLRQTIGNLVQVTILEQWASVSRKIKWFCVWHFESWLCAYGNVGDVMWPWWTA